VKQGGRLRNHGGAPRELTFTEERKKNQKKGEIPSFRLREKITPPQEPADSPRAKDSKIGCYILDEGTIETTNVLERKTMHRSRTEPSLGGGEQKKKR